MINNFFSEFMLKQYITALNKFYKIWFQLKDVRAKRTPLLGSCLWAMSLN